MTKLLRSSGRRRGLAGRNIRPRLPKIPKLDFRVEGGYTDPPNSGATSHMRFLLGCSLDHRFSECRSPDGSWMGRQRARRSGLTTYWFSRATSSSLDSGIRKSATVHSEWRHAGRRERPGGVLAAIKFQPVRLRPIRAVEFSSRRDHQTVNVSSAVQVSFWAQRLSRKNSGQ